MAEPLRDAAYHRRKADQAWELAGLARQDNDRADAARHTEDARKHERLYREALSHSAQG
jgi:hypothetical protein